ncbi:bifunctional [glutamine synthetase] adenylyltransferase/[glutamine synthetase]-adenylyl-L-tyrosine phosphorylase [Sphingorhabdus arenilitoris]|uniref:Bifunctional [glutamine synthetase] adenylyltransferase/[glutamine synthetase]-adenylyl-L-tyrosine phosphorylase n=1 Tax=Sphingorhabdus arenilitoris TaxID=1490041 RepID=A0ABV8RKE6_9SPHN
MTTHIADALSRAENNSPFLSGLMKRHPALLEMIAAGDLDGALANALALDGDDIAAMLRRRRQGLALVTAIGDLSGLWDLTKVTAILSDFADSALDMAIAAAIEERVPGAPVQGFAVIALGKHGGRELNYSSDIDPIFLFDPKTLPCRDGDDPQESAVRIGKRIIQLLDHVDENGYVFRVDMRLRPSPEVSPVALPVEAAIGYYESSALAWEQAAFIRARFAAGDETLGSYFLRSIDSFIWRRSLDFGQLKNIQQMSAQIRDHYSRGQKAGPGYDLKRGRGGIRECEFFAQAHQLIHGGRDPALRIADTRTALSALAQAGWIGEEEAQALSESYATLRQVEHRLQMMNDRQTHSLPNDLAGCEAVARLHDLSSAEELLAQIAPHIARVQEIYDGLAKDDGEGAPPLAADNLPLLDQLQSIGFTDADNVAKRIARWRSGKLRAVRSDAARDAFEAVLPEMMTAFIASPDPERALARFDSLIEALPSAVNFFLLLEARPKLRTLLGHILSYAPTLADVLARRAELLDGLIDATALNLPAGTDELVTQMQTLTSIDDYQLLLDNVRIFVGERRFALGVQLIEGQHDPLRVARGYAHLAEAAVQILTQATIAEFKKAHGSMPNGELVILALGRLGGEGLTHASDLDLVMLFTGSYETESDGPKPLGATQYFNRLAQRVVAALSVPTASGALYEIDTRLRPSGEQGLLCVSMDSFERYQRNDAWTWEHMALTRARPVFGSANARGAAQQVIDSVLAQPRDIQKLINDVAAMRAEMDRHKPPKGPLDFKLMPGGLVDSEFIVHMLQLSGRAKPVPQLGDAIAMLTNSGDLPENYNPADALLSRFLIILRLVAPDCEIPGEATQRLIAQILKYDDWDKLMLAVEKARSIVLEEWNKYLPPRDSLGTDQPGKG